MSFRPPEGPIYPGFKRRIPERLFYVVPALMWLALSIRHGGTTLPSAANPALEAGGLWGESKSQGLGLFGPAGRKALAPFVVVDCTARTGLAERAQRAMAAAGLAFPVVGKPDRGYQGWGVRLLETPQELACYLAAQPENARVLLQELVDLPGEAGIFYVREPGERRGRIVSMAFVYPPHVIGDGERTVAQLVEADCVLRANAAIYRERASAAWNRVLAPDAFFCLTNARSARLGAVYRNAFDEVAPELEAEIDRISREIPDFHFGRFDIRFRSVEELRQGRGFQIVELNGAGAEMLHIWAGTAGLGAAYRTLWRQYRILFSIAAEMRRRGARPLGLAAMTCLQRRQEKLRAAYPPSS